MTKEQDDFVEDTRKLIKWNNEKTKKSLSDPHPDWPAVESLISIIDLLKKNMEDAIGFSVDSHRREDNAVLKINELKEERDDLLLLKKYYEELVTTYDQEEGEFKTKIKELEAENKRLLEKGQLTDEEIDKLLDGLND